MQGPVVAVELGDIRGVLVLLRSCDKSFCGGREEKMLISRDSEASSVAWLCSFYNHGCLEQGSGAQWFSLFLCLVTTDCSQADQVVRRP